MIFACERFKPPSVHPHRTNQCIIIFHVYSYTYITNMHSCKNNFEYRRHKLAEYFILTMSFFFYSAQFCQFYLVFLRACTTPKLIQLKEAIFVSFVVAFFCDKTHTHLYRVICHRLNYSFSLVFAGAVASAESRRVVRAYHSVRGKYKTKDHLGYLKMNIFF